MSTLKERLGMKGRLHIVLRDEFGNIKDERFIDNLIVSGGKTFAASRMVGVASNVMSHMAVGTVNTAEVVGDTALGAEIARVALASGTSSGNVVTYTATFVAGTGTGALVEAGIFNAVSGPTMLNRATFPVVNKGGGDTMTITWTVTFN